MNCAKPASWLFVFVSVLCLGAIDTVIMRSANAAGDNCSMTFWPTCGRVVEIEACELGEESISGYTKLINNT